MKRIMLIIGAAVISTALGAQMSFGPKAGLSHSKLRIDDSFNTNDGIYRYNTVDAKTGFHAGLFARVCVAGFFVQPEVLFTSAGGTVEVRSPNAVQEIRELNYNKLDMPVLAGKKFLGFVRAEIGPVFSLMLSDDARNTELVSEVKQNYNSSTIGYQMGVGIDISKVYIDLRYEVSLSKFGDSINIGSGEFSTDMRTSIVSLSVGINLL